MTDLEQRARDIRAGAVKAVHAARSGHPGGSLSIADMLAVLYFDEMNVDPAKPDAPGRDRFVLSKGHACPALYIALAMKGFFPMEEALKLRKLEGFMEGHPDVRIPGVDAPSGSLGMGLSQGLGMAIGAKLQGLDFRTYVIVGDGDMQEGNSWEAIMSAGFKKMDNLVAIYDANKLQGDAPVETQLDLGDVAAKVAPFGWHVIELDGHDIGALKAALAEARATKGKPTFIVADTVKGKGVSFMENVLYWHGSVTMSDEELANALSELEDA
ncbi:transketolase [Kordiimonas marina]|uniref:transketolase n=1 Tax=Kordiimonas marina TaxID=2872312 RepID=UPI001FF67657|nr:transketolase [Kordiimonas marina]MCJ9430321.1 transketolase [Kordiimonas marina]